MSIHEHDHDQLRAVRFSWLDHYRQESRDRDDHRLERRLTVRRIVLQHVEERRLRDSRSGYPDAHAARIRYDHLERVISADVQGGSTRHSRLPWLVRQIPRLVAVIDCVVLFTFCGEIFNVLLNDPLRTPIPSLAAALLAVLASGVAYTWLALTGDRLKVFRGELGEVLWRVVGATTWFMIAGSVVLVTALAVLMYSRVFDEIQTAGDAVAAGTAAPLGVVFAVISAVANLSVVAVHALDGSPEADERRFVGRLLRRHQKSVNHNRLAVIRAAGRIRGRRVRDDGHEYERSGGGTEQYSQSA